MPAYFRLISIWIKTNFFKPSSNSSTIQYIVTERTLPCVKNSWNRPKLQVFTAHTKSLMGSPSLWVIFSAWNFNSTIVLIICIHYKMYCTGTKRESSWSWLSHEFFTVEPLSGCPARFQKTVSRYFFALYFDIEKTFLGPIDMSRT